jgi:hypothetical protein
MDDKTQIHLSKEIEKLGFNNDEYSSNGSLTIRGSIIHISASVPIEDASETADYLGVLFTFRNIENHMPVLDMIYAALLKEDVAGNMVSLVEKSYSLDDAPLPKKEQIYKDLTDALQIKKIQEKFNINENPENENIGNKIKLKNRL